jgi:hypothetical protein
MPKYKSIKKKNRYKTVKYHNKNSHKINYKNTYKNKGRGPLKYLRGLGQSIGRRLGLTRANNRTNRAQDDEQARQRMHAWFAEQERLNAEALALRAQALRAQAEASRAQAEASQAQAEASQRIQAEALVRASLPLPQPSSPPSPANNNTNYYISKLLKEIKEVINEIKLLPTIVRNYPNSQVYINNIYRTANRIEITLYDASPSISENPYIIEARRNLQDALGDAEARLHSIRQSQENTRRRQVYNDNI